MTDERLPNSETGVSLTKEMDRVHRYDLARFSPRTKRTPQGFLRAPAFFTRAGIFEYQRADGSVIRELRPADEVFAAESVSTASNVPITVDHPTTGMVNSRNAKSLAVGFSGEKTERKDAMLAGNVLITDADVIADVESGKLREISMGYTCKIDPTAGVDADHGRYDQIQRNIRYNHAALLGPNQGRAGTEVGLRLDANGAEQRADAFTSLELFVKEKAGAKGMGLDQVANKSGLGDSLEPILYGFEKPTTAQLTKIASTVGVESETLRGLVPGEGRADSKQEIKKMETETVTIGGVDFEVPKAAAQALSAEASRVDAKISDLEKEKEALQGRLDASTEKLGEVNSKLDELSDTERFDAAVAERVELLGKARKVLGDEAEIEGSRREIMEQVIKHDKADLDLSDKSDDYVEARFDAFLETFRVDAEAKKRKSETRRLAHQITETENRSDSKSAHARMLEENRNAWKVTNADKFKA